MTHWQIIALCGVAYFGFWLAVIFRQMHVADARARSEAEQRNRDARAERLRCILDAGECDDWCVRSMNVGAASDFHADLTHTYEDRNHG